MIRAKRASLSLMMEVSECDVGYEDTKLNRIFWFGIPLLLQLGGGAPLPSVSNIPDLGGISKGFSPKDPFNSYLCAALCAVLCIVYVCDFVSLGGADARRCQRIQ